MYIYTDVVASHWTMLIVIYLYIYNLLYIYILHTHIHRTAQSELAQASNVQVVHCHTSNVDEVTLPMKLG